MPVPEETFRVYLDDLEQIPPLLLEAAMTRLIRTMEFFPTIRAIRETCAELALDLSSEVEALRLVEQHLAATREGITGVPPVPPLITEAVKLAGGYRVFRTSDEPAVVRGQFARYYRELRAAAVLEAQLHPSIHGGERRLAA